MEFMIEGLDGLLKELDRLGEKSDAVAENALKAGGAVVQEEAKRIVRKRSYKLEKTIKVSSLKRERGTGERYVEVGSSLFYSRFLEFGTCKMTAKPFMTPALLGKKDELQDAMAKAIKEGLGL